MKTLLMTFLLLTQAAFAQVYVTRESEMNLKFNGSLFTETKNQKSVITIRQSGEKQTLLIVSEVRDFKFIDDFQEEEFNEVFMESHFFPQIRISGAFKENVDLSRDGNYQVSIPAKLTMRGQSKITDINARLEIIGGLMTIHFEKNLLLADFLIPYAGPGSQIGHEARMKFTADLKRTH